jgi:hypothetical protein
MMSSELSLRPGIFGGKKLRANNDHLRAKDPQNGRIMVSALIFSVLALSPDWILAQGLFGSITGVVTDPTGTVVPKELSRLCRYSKYQTLNEGVKRAYTLRPLL